ncbi:MAG: biosynthetic-type acetolactate synthase large subunit [Clostridiales bacterium]|jgi:acetolactate synthase-1/2/3 large subunit|nr:biosynthetic-type acetolactate synthase large subunit [Clostridiales bacterium]
MKLSGAEILVECLKEQHVDVLFGYPGGAVLNIYDALYKHQDEITHYRTAHEQGAAHAADGYARATGRTGVCLATSGPGATNLVTGIATAYMDSVPMVAITGNVNVPLLGKDSFQEVDIAGITLPITKHNFIVKNINDLAGVIRKAFAIAQDGRQGPVLVDIPKDVTAQTAEYAYQTPTPRRVRKSAQAGLTLQAGLEKAAALLNQSQKPLIYTGGGIIASGASPELKELVETLNAPIASSAMGLGGFPGSDSHFTGMLGMHGTGASNFAATECDLFMAIGVRFSDRVVGSAPRFAPNAKILHFDIDPAEINKNIRASHSVTGNLPEILKRLIPMLHPMDHTEWTARVSAMKERYPLRYQKDGILRPQYVIERIGALRGPDDVIVTEVGQHQMWACQYIQYHKPRSFISSGGLGTMGYGLGAAIGAVIGLPKDRTVFNIAGDGSFRMNSIELATAVDYNIPLVEVILSNHALGMVRQWQNLFYEKRYSQTDIIRNLDFHKLAEAYQAAAFTVTESEQVDGVLREAIDLAKRSRKPAVINCEVGPDDNVFPMVPPGAGIDELVME